MHTGLANDVKKFALASLHRFAAFNITCILKRAAVTMISQQNPGFLVRFADRGDPQSALRSVKSAPAPAMIGPFKNFISNRRLPSGKHQRAGGEIDLVMAFDHQDLKLRQVAK